MLIIQTRNILYFFFNATAPAEIYTLSLHDALPISWRVGNPQDLKGGFFVSLCVPYFVNVIPLLRLDRKSTRLNSSHRTISYAVFCLKKKNNKQTTNPTRLYTTINRLYLLTLIIVIF